MRTRSDHFGPVTIRCTSGSVTPWEVFPDQHGRTPGSPRPPGHPPGRPAAAAYAPARPRPATGPPAPAGGAGSPPHGSPAAADRPPGTGRRPAPMPTGPDLRTRGGAQLRPGAGCGPPGRPTGAAGPITGPRTPGSRTCRRVGPTAAARPRAGGAGAREEERGDPSEPLRIDDRRCPFEGDPYPYARFALCPPPPSDRNAGEKHSCGLVMFSLSPGGEGNGNPEATHPVRVAEWQTR